VREGERERERLREKVEPIHHQPPAIASK